MDRRRERERERENRRDDRDRDRDRNRDRSDDDDEEPHVYCFVPGEDIDVVILAAYLKRWIDGTATIQPSRHPKDTNRLGFTVGACSTLNREALEDLIYDTRKWYKEQQLREFRKNPYDYIDSDTFQERKRKGPTVAALPVKLAKPRDRRSTTDTTASANRGGNTEPGRGRHADTESKNPPTYQEASYGSRPRSRSPIARQPDPQQPDPDAFRQMSLSDEQRPLPNQSTRIQAPATGRHGQTVNIASVNRVDTKNAPKNSGASNDNSRKAGRHD